MNKFYDSFTKNLHSFVGAGFDFQETPLFLPIYSRRNQYKPSVKLFERSDKREMNLRKLFG